MQTQISLKTKKPKLLRWGTAWLLLAAAVAAPKAQAQLPAVTGERSRIRGAVLLDGEAQPAARVRVDIKALTGGDVASTFTDTSGRFETPATGPGSYVVTVQEQGYEPAEQRVDASLDGNVQDLVITLRKVRVSLAQHRGYLVSVHDLKVPGKARHAFQKGMERLQKKDAVGSIGYFKEATNAFPDYYEAYYQIGVANLELRRGDDAEQALQTAIDMSGGGYAEPQFALGALLCDRHEYTNAERVLRRSIEVDGNSWKGHLFLAQALFGLNRLAEAEKSAHEALLRRSDVSAAYVLLANVHIRRQEYVTAIQDLDTFLKMKPVGQSSDQARAVRAAVERVVSRLSSMATVTNFVY